jgi:hypothetical protein
MFIYDAVTVRRLISVPAARLPGQTSPIGRHIVFTFVTKKGNPQLWIIAISQRPFPGVVGNG